MSDYEEIGRHDKPGPYDVNNAKLRDCTKCKAPVGMRCVFMGTKIPKSCPCVERLKESDG